MTWTERNQIGNYPTYANGSYVVFHSSDAGQPDCFREGWYFEPNNFAENMVFSSCFQTAEEAKKAAEEWQEGENNES